MAAVTELSSLLLLLLRLSGPDRCAAMKARRTVASETERDDCMSYMHRSSDMWRERERERKREREREREREGEGEIHWLQTRSNAQMIA